MTFEGQMSTIDGEGDWEEKWEVSPINYGEMGSGEMGSSLVS